MSSGSKCTCKNKHLHGHGTSRSLVRKIGSSLPINTGKRIYIRIPGMDSPLVRSEDGFRYDEATGQHYVPDEEGLTLASYINNPRQLFSKATGLFQMGSIDDESVEHGEKDMDTEEMGLTGGGELVGGKQDTMERISSLESELAKLRAQIAIYASAEVELDTQPVVPAPPPPPPPPPPAATPMQQPVLPSTLIASTPSSSEAVQMHSHTHPQPAEFLTTSAQPGMTDILRDIGSVKLRTVDMVRSPGGTPLRPTNRTGRAADPNDPASIIALALRKKFAHRVFKDSPDKENLDSSDASLPPPMESPTIRLLKQDRK